MTHHRFYLSVITGLFALSACSSGDVAGLGVQAVSGTGTPAGQGFEVADDGATAFTLQSAYVHLRDIELDLPDGQSCADIADLLVNATCDGGSSKIVVAGPFDIDLMAGTATPSLADVIIPAGTYKRIDFRVDDNPAETSFAVVAAFERDAQAYTLDLALDFNEDIRVESPLGVNVAADTDLITEFVVDDWLAGVDVGGCMDAGDVTMDGAVVIIDEGSTSGACSGIEDTIKTNMKESGQLDKL